MRESGRSALDEERDSQWFAPLVPGITKIPKKGLDLWVDPALAEVNARVAPPISRDEAARVYDGDRRLWPLLSRLERANRWWQRTVRRRPFEFLVPERTTYEEARPGRR